MTFHSQNHICKWHVLIFFRNLLSFSKQNPISFNWFLGILNELSYTFLWLSYFSLHRNLLLYYCKRQLKKHQYKFLKKPCMIQWFADRDLYRCPSGYTTTSTITHPDTPWIPFIKDPSTPKPPNIQMLDLPPPFSLPESPNFQMSAAPYWHRTKVAWSLVIKPPFTSAHAFQNNPLGDTRPPKCTPSLLSGNPKGFQFESRFQLFSDETPTISSSYQFMITRWKVFLRHLQNNFIRTSTLKFDLKLFYCSFIHSFIIWRWKLRSSFFHQVLSSFICNDINET